MLFLWLKALLLTMAGIKTTLSIEDQYKTFGNERKRNGDPNQNLNQTASDLNSTDESSFDLSHYSLANTENESSVADQIPITFLKVFGNKSSKFREKRTSDCPLSNRRIWTKKMMVQLHVLPRKVPFSIFVWISTERRESDNEYFQWSSDKLDIRNNKWSHFKIRAYATTQYWGVIIVGDGINVTSVSNVSKEQYFKHLKVRIWSDEVSWYVGEKNLNCDHIISKTVALPTTPTKTPWTTGTRITTSTLKPFGKVSKKTPSTFQGTQTAPSIFRRASTSVPSNFQRVSTASHSVIYGASTTISSVSPNSTTVDSTTKILSVSTVCFDKKGKLKTNKKSL